MLLVQYFRSHIVVFEQPPLVQFGRRTFKVQSTGIGRSRLHISWLNQHQSKLSILISCSRIPPTETHFELCESSESTVSLTVVLIIYEARNPGVCVGCSVPGMNEWCWYGGAAGVLSIALSTLDIDAME